MRSRTAAASPLSFALDIGTKWYHTRSHTVPRGTTAAWRAITKGDTHVTATRILWEHRIQRDRVGDCRGTLHLAGAPPSTTRGGVATAAHPTQLPLPRNGIPGPGRRIAGSAARLRDCRGLWRHHRCGSGAVVDADAAKDPRLPRRVDFQRLGLRRSRERLLPG